MTGNLIKILPFLVVTIVIVAGVELFYRFGEDYLFSPERPDSDVSIPQASVSREDEKSKGYEDYGIILDRDLFQPFAGEVSDTPEKEELSLEGLQASKLDLVLMGTVVGEDDQHRAIILDKKKAKQEIFNTGDYVQGAEIKRIIRGKVVLGYQGRDEVLDMSEAASIRRSQQPVQPAVSPNAARTRFLRAQGTSRTRVVQPRRRVISPRTQADEVPPPEQEAEVYAEEGGVPEEGGASEEGGVTEEGGVPDEQAQNDTAPEEGGAPLPAE